MQQKIANLEIKVFYDSAVTNRQRENYQSPTVESQVLYKYTDGIRYAGKVTAEKMQKEKCFETATQLIRCSEYS